MQKRALLLLTCVLVTQGLASISAASAGEPVRTAFWGFDGARAAQLGTAWEIRLGEFSSGAYDSAVEALISDFEARSQRRLIPGPTGHAGLKVYTNSGAGMGTPLDLTRAVIRALEKRGFTRDALFVIDASEANLRDCGYLPLLSEMHRGYNFEGVPVLALDRELYRDDQWFYDNPLPRQTSSTFGSEVRAALRKEHDPNDRKSFMAAPLINGCDFWINLPCVTDHPAMGLNGVLANGTLWTVSNRERFFYSTANAPIAIAEIAAIPEMMNNCALNLISLEHYQYIGGPMFNSLYTRSEPLLWLSVNPVILDATMVERLNAARESTEFKPIEQSSLQLEYAETLGLGPRSQEKVNWIRR
ncbi:MAG: DUF362 domain-containing protein [Verrucomicrobiota bacterium]|nr:DUF362 domain-containing protein [Verrucomicrobiota bacterium]